MPIQDKLPKSRITLVYRTNINGQEEDVKLPFRVVVLGDFSLGSATDRQVDLEERKLRSVTGSNLSDLMRDMGMSISFEVDDKVSADGEGKMAIALPIDQMKSFHPDEIVHHVPKLKALLLMRKLLLEMQSDIDNRKDLRRKLYELFSNKEELKKLLESEQLKSYASMRLPVAKPQDDKPALAAQNVPAVATAKA
ncbi:type VI secretion system contractile sheath small subunit [Vitiosangium sp. GDMCC 1.1324]|uniref:type VI secretion system contractile sheath small subunit n=1 Tax=Vitiosangium sp. (strain GDMCC 1.1324) TaxID=2138576 RepID=UPI000D37A442|nr:type VI secretion system contractile sheath small subunit [Vitiosangium sp. GDMCC 1.1324]PTL85383.1 type VI secretion system contractile sheath small subunit [Vitiosangium sp. GDMCC 1.1324]